MSDATRQLNRELLQTVFDAAYHAMLDAGGHRYNTSSDVYMTEELVVEAAREGCKKATREALDLLRGVEE